MKNKLPDMTLTELKSYREKWGKKRGKFQQGSKNHQKSSHRIKRANIRIEAIEAKQ